MARPLSGDFAQEDTALAPLDGRLHVALMARRLQFDNLEEPGAFNPASAYVPQTGGWERQWREDDVYAAICYDLVDGERIVLRPGINLGISRGFFKARSEQAAFYETWELETAFLWGPSLYAEARLKREAGLFVSFDLAYFMAEAGEADETIGSQRATGSRPEDRDAFFRWTRLETTLAAGWRLGAFTPRLGARYRDFSLKKTLTHHVSEMGASGNGLALIQALNSQPSRYGYAAGTRFVPFVELAFQPLPNISLTGSSILSTDQDFSFQAVISF